MSDNETIISNIGAAMRSLGHTTDTTAAAISMFSKDNADWAEGFSTICVEAALQRMGDFADCCRGSIRQWKAAMRQNLREVARYVVDCVCRTACLSASAEELSQRMGDVPYIDDYALLRPANRLSDHVAATDIDAFFKPHKSLTVALSEECLRVVSEAKLCLRELFDGLLAKLRQLREETMRKEARQSVEVVTWVKTLRRLRAEVKERLGKDWERERKRMVAEFDGDESAAKQFMTSTLEDMMSANVFHDLYVQAGRDETRFAMAVRRKSGSCEGTQLDAFITAWAKAEWLSSSEECGVRSEELILTDRQQHAFELAVSRGYMKSRSDGTYEWRLKPVTLSYFLGRLFAGDYPKTDLSGCRIWHSGSSSFPDKKLQQLFSMKNVGVARRKGLGGNVPEEAEIIERLIYEIEGE